MPWIVFLAACTLAITFAAALCSLRSEFATLDDGNPLFWLASEKSSPSAESPPTSSSSSSKPSVDVLPDKRIDCTKFDGIELPAPSPEHYRTMQRAYLQSKKTDKDPLWDGPRMENYKHGNGGMKIPFEVRQSPGKGRGLFATTIVPKGTIVFRNDLTGRFRSAREWYEFLYRLPELVACDVLTWVYPAEEDPESGQSPIEIDLNAGGLMNSGDTLKYKDDDPKTGVIIASRNLKPGDQLEIRYSSFVVGSSPYYKEATAPARYQKGGIVLTYEGGLFVKD